MLEHDDKQLRYNISDTKYNNNNNNNFNNNNFNNNNNNNNNNKIIKIIKKNCH